jgi:ATP dependent DNA ligase domain
MPRPAGCRCFRRIGVGSWLAYHPQRAKTVPAGDDWQHEIKIDGFRVQIHKLGNEVELYSRNGSRFSRRSPRLVEVLRELRAKSAIVDGEIVASDVAGMPAKPAELHVWGFAEVVIGSAPGTPAGRRGPVRHCSAHGTDLPTSALQRFVRCWTNRPHPTAIVTTPNQHLTPGAVHT